jgi:hypothetical protein
MPYLGLRRAEVRAQAEQAAERESAAGRGTKKVASIWSSNGPGHASFPPVIGQECNRSSPSF